MSNDWICHEIKGPKTKEDLEKLDITFFTGGLAFPILEDEEIPTEDADLFFEETEEEQEDEGIIIEEDY